MWAVASLTPSCPQTAFSTSGKHYPLTSHFSCKIKFIQALGSTRSRKVLFHIKSSFLGILSLLLRSWPFLLFPLQRLLGIIGFVSSALVRAWLLLRISTPLCNLRLYFGSHAFSCSNGPHHQLLKQIQVSPNLSSENILNPSPSRVSHTTLSHKGLLSESPHFQTNSEYAWISNNKQEK